jgi:hypothetical protein
MEQSSLTSSYMAQPIMFSATMTGPETEKTEPYCSSPEPLLPSGAIVCVAAEDLMATGELLVVL